MTVPADEPTQKIVVLRTGMELTRIAHTPGGSAYVETYRPVTGMVLDLPLQQAEAIVRNGAGTFYVAPDATP